MDEPRAQRTLVKSPPELWAKVSDEGALAGHLGAFGEIRIVRLEPETTVAWEGDRACGTVELEPAGWGTKVTLTARIEEQRAEPEPAAAPEPERAEPAPATEPPAAAPLARRRGLLARLFRRRRSAEPEPERGPERGPAPEPASRPEAHATPEPPAQQQPEPAPRAVHEPAPLDAGRAKMVLVGVLDDLGAAHHRPFSRG
jgi:hypothetical protein